MQGFMASNPLYISALKNDRNFVSTKCYHFNNDTLNTVLLNNTDIHKIMIKSRFYESNSEFSELSLGDTFVLGKYKVASEDLWDIEWEIVHQTDTYQIAQTKYIIDIRNFDAMEPNNPDTNIQTNGDSRWALSNIKQFLNSDQETWYSAQHQYDQAPIDACDGYGYNGYEDHPGFLYYFSDKEKSLLKDMTITLANSVFYGGGSYTWTGKVWLPTYTQLGFGNNNSISEGIKFDKYSDDNSRIKSINKYCAENNKYCIDNNKTEGTNWYYWMSSNLISSVFKPYNVAYDGRLHIGDACWGDGGLAPCICLGRSKSLNMPVTFTLNKVNNNTSTEIGKIYVDNKNNLGVLVQDISLNENEVLSLSCDNPAIEAEYDLIAFCS